MRTRYIVLGSLAILAGLLTGCTLKKSPYRFSVGEQVVIQQTGEVVVVLQRRWGHPPGSPCAGGHHSNWYRCRVGMGTERYTGGLLAPSTDVLHVYAEVYFREWELASPREDKQ